MLSVSPETALRKASFKVQSYKLSKSEVPGLFTSKREL